MVSDLSVRCWRGHVIVWCFEVGMTVAKEISNMTTLQHDDNKAKVIFEGNDQVTAADMDGDHEARLQGKPKDGP